MKIERSWSLPAGVDDVLAMIVDEEFQRRKAEGVGERSDVRVEETPNGHTVRVTRDFPTTDFPDAVRSFVGATMTVVEAQAWQEGPAGPFAGLVVEVKGTPARLKGKVTLTADGDSTVVRVLGDLTGGVPIIGRKIEQTAAPFFLSALEHEERVSREWLAE